MNRRHFLSAACLASFAPARAAAPSTVLDLVVDAAGFHAPGEDIKAVLLSAANEIWRHCATTRFEFGFRVVRDPEHPIAHYEHENGRIVIGLNTEKTFWAQYAYQFAHEFCHALAGHSNHWQLQWRNGRHANLWLEEALCETASLFALRAMALRWETEPPYPNWRDFGKNLADYAQKRLDDPAHQLPAGQTFADWFALAEPVQRAKWTRENNTVIAARLLPIFEAEPSGWDAVAALNLCQREEKKTLARFLAEWKTNAQPQYSAFIEKVTRVFPL